MPWPRHAQNGLDGWRPGAHGLLREKVVFRVIRFRVTWGPFSCPSFWNQTQDEASPLEATFSNTVRRVP
eukprot:67012-Lingulodinium_polyedra.AAC.1